MNPVAETLTGWTQAEAAGHDVSEVFRIIDSVTGQPAPSPVAKVLASGMIVGLANHTALIARDGTQRQVADSGAPILDSDGQIKGVVLVFRDVTDEYENRESLRIALERSQQYLDVAAVMFITLDRQGRITLLNKKGGEILGYEPSELIGKDWFATCLPQHMEKNVRKVFNSLMRGEIEPVEYYENTVLHKNKTERLIAFNNTVIRDAEGRITAILSSGDDITERRRAERELVRSNRALIALSSASEALVNAVDEVQFMTNLCRLIVDGAGYQLAWIGFADDDAAKTVRPVAQYGYEEGYLESLRISWGDDEFGRGPTGIAIRSGKPAIARDTQNAPDDSSWHKEAHKFGFNSSIAVPLILDGRTVGALHVYATESDAFVESETMFLMNLANDVAMGIRSLREHIGYRRLALAVDQTEDMILVSDTSGIIQYINKAFSTVTGYGSDEVVGKNVSMLRADETAENDFQGMWNNLISGLTWKGNFVNRKKNGDLYHVEASISPIRSQDGELKSYVAVYRDITNQLALESQLRQAQKMEAIGTLAGGISHDFNNLLGIILGYTELVMDQTPEDDPRYHDLQDVFLAGKRARDLVAQLLTFSRQTEGEVSPIKVAPILKESVKFMRASLPSTIAIQADIYDSDLMILGCPTQLHQVIMNLCTNGAAAMEDGGGVLELGLDRLDVNTEEKAAVVNGPHAVFTVRDSGSGFDNDVQNRLFDPFFTTKEVGKGTGLGLAVVHGIVTNAKGFIEVESQPGMGSTFRVYWPLAADVEESKEAAPAIADPEGSYRVMYVDDEVGIARLGVLRLDKLGYKVEMFTDANRAWKRLQEAGAQFDVVVSDQTMPGMTGIELFRKIATLGVAIPKILCSGTKTDISTEEQKRLDIRSILQKPFLADDLAWALYAVFHDEADDS